MFQAIGTRRIFFVDFTDHVKLVLTLCKTLVIP